ncbi:MAG: hypothetical protein HZC29_05205 [Thaumarchaeota archaeon]|nr:hypothetical protein [Nitrososphaerota archaeon]
MGLRYGKRNRLERARNIPEATLVSLGATNIKFENFDEQLIADQINANLAKQQARINSQ